MHFSFLQILSDIPHAFVDVETTGASVDFGHRVIELGIVRYERGHKVAEYQQLIDPRRPISAGITALTGISTDMVRGMPTFAEQLLAALKLLEGAAVLGHNVRFDLSFLRKEFRGAGNEITQALGDVPVLDTVRIARRRFGRGGNGLQNLAARMGFSPSAAHRALADAQTTAWVYETLMQPVGGWNTSLFDAIREQGGPMSLLPANPRESLLPLELEEALEQRVPVRMEYLDARDVRTFRVVRPVTIRRRGGELLLLAHCQLRNEQRTFKVERVVKFWRLDAPPTDTPSLFDLLPPARVESHHGQIQSSKPAAHDPTGREIATDPGPVREPAIDPGSLRQPAPGPAVSD